MPQSSEANDHHPTGASRYSTGDVLGLLALTVLIALILGKDLTVGGLRSMDAPVHAMDGVLIHDWVAAGPTAWVDPMEFALKQYSHYPSLSIGRHYPPGFAIVEAFFFGLFGISAVSARLCILFFGMAAVSGVYMFLRSFTTRTASLLGGIVLLTMPAVTHWGRQAMLELPTLAVLSWGAVAFTWYIARPNAKRLALVIATALLAPVFRQNGVFLIGAVAVAITCCAYSRRVPWRHVIYSGVAALLAAITVVLSLDELGSTLVRGYDRGLNLHGWESLTYYLRQLPGESGWLVVVAAIVGLGITLRRPSPHAILLLAWFALSYVMVTILEYKAPRLFFVGLFPVAVWCAIGMDRAFALVPIKIARGPFVLAAVIALSIPAFGQEIRHYPDHGPVVIANRSRIEGHAVLFSGLRDGDFVFAVRQHVPWRTAVVIRASKLLYSCHSQPLIDLQSFAGSIAEVEALLDRYALPFLFIERKNRIQVREDALLREYLAATHDYRRIAAYPLKAEAEPGYRDVTLDVYELVNPPARTVQYIDVPISRIGRTVRVDLSDLTG